MTRKQNSTLKTTRRGGRDYVDTARILDGAQIDLPTVTLDGSRTGDAVYAPIPVGDRIILGRADDPRIAGAGNWIVTAQRLDRPWPGTEQTVTFACERLVWTPGGVTTDYAVGFFDEAECWRHLTGKGTQEVTVYDLHGRPSKERRDGLGIPDSAVDRAVLLDSAELIAAARIAEAERDLSTAEAEADYANEQRRARRRARDAARRAAAKAAAPTVPNKLAAVDAAERDAEAGG